MGEKSRFWIAFSILLLAFAVFTVMSVWMTVEAHAQAQPACMPYPDLTKTLADAYGESPAGSGIMQSGKSVMLIFVSPKGQSWTAALLKPDLTACVMAHGSDWFDVIEPQFSSKGRLPS